MRTLGEKEQRVMSLDEAIAMLRDGDVITINAEDLTISMDVTDEEMARRREAWVMPPYKYTRGTMSRYINTVSSAQKGCVTDE